MLSIVTEYDTKIKEWLQVFEAVRRTFGAKIKEVKKRVSKAKRLRGFAGLPDEILDRIFELASDSDKYEVGSEEQAGMDNHFYHISLRLSSVCRRFRSIMLSNPTHWNEIDTILCLSHKHVNIFLTRCGVTGVSLDIDATLLRKWLGNDIQTHLPGIVAACADRAKRIEFRGSLVWLNSVLQSCGSLTFKKLEVLLINIDHVDEPPSDSNDILSTLVQNPLLTAFQLLEQEAPILQSLTVANYDVFQELPFPPIPPTVKDFHVYTASTPTGPVLYEDPDGLRIIQPFLDFIHRSTDLSIVDADLRISGHTPLTPFRSTWGLTSLRLIVVCSGMLPLLSISFPNLLDFDLSVQRVDGPGSESPLSDPWKYTFIPFMNQLFSGNNFPVLQRLILDHNEHHQGLPALELGSLFQCCTRLVGLQLKRTAGYFLDSVIPTTVRSISLVQFLVDEDTVQRIIELADRHLHNLTNAVDSVDVPLDITIMDSEITNNALYQEDIRDNVQCKSNFFQCNETLVDIILCTSGIDCYEAEPIQHNNEYERECFSRCSTRDSRNCRCSGGHWHC